jgi:8-oxo-dGTP pyrophosphatase MutT (NUDIX family)
MLEVWSRLDALPPVPTPEKAKAAVLVPLYEDAAGEVRVVLTKRPGDMPTHAHDIVFPGGMMHGDDAGPVETAIREACEEVGLPPQAVEVLGGLSPITTRSREMLIVPVVARVKRPVELKPDPREVEVILEPRLVHLLDESRWKSQDWHGHRLWFYDFPEGVLWGATAFMMRELLGYLRE